MTKRVRQSKNVLITEMSWEPLPQRHIQINTFLNIKSTDDDIHVREKIAFNRCFLRKK